MKSADADGLEMKSAGTDSVQSLGKGWGRSMRGKLGSSTGADMNKEVVHRVCRHSRGYCRDSPLATHHVPCLAPDGITSLLGDPVRYMAPDVRPESCAGQAVRAEVRLGPVATQPRGPGSVSQQLADIGVAEGLRSLTVLTGALRWTIGLNRLVNK